MKLFALIKIAGWFGNTRNFIRLLDSKGVKINRKGKFKNDSKLSVLQYMNNDIEKTISIPRHTKNPVHYLFHEGGHALQIDKIKPEKLFTRNTDPLTMLKRERIANNNALQYITDKNDRKSYMKIIKNNANRNEAYGTYKRNVVNKNNNNIIDKAYDIKKKKSNLKLNTIKNQLKEKNKMHIVSAINPSLNKKPWVR